MEDVMPIPTPVIPMGWDIFICPGAEVGSLLAMDDMPMPDIPIPIDIAVIPVLDMPMTMPMPIPLMDIELPIP